ncbi:hypothetical protein PHISCL_09613 [Aspergillus sclerotialis]|uniref:Xylanolytic transcriptional activator regulatory domain-containing protein n=1 Tax=Aspergillus sclerotialis TaxID=2070753 RepID=A0A3A2Z774_9EURO|nr:hypothetical protein PHISCL_09613 [Aspergillus sclerotialis]
MPRDPYIRHLTHQAHSLEIHLGLLEFAIQPLPQDTILKLRIRGMQRMTVCHHLRLVELALILTIYIVDIPAPYDSASRDGLSGVNLHTNGTEFYGNSSNLAFLGNLYAGARSQARNRVPDEPETEFSPAHGHSTPERARLRRNFHGQHSLPHEEPTEAASHTRSASEKTQPSIVNLLYNPNYSTSPISTPQKNDQNEMETTSPATNPEGLSQNIIEDRRAAITSTLDQLPPEAQLEIEKIFIGSYFSNKHYIHPMLCKRTFMKRCELEAWKIPRRPGFSKGQSKFGGLYFAVVALGAINASSQETSLLDHYCGGYTSLDFADFYFGVAKQALGDIFESSSIESAQALLLMCVYCQNALRPHSCFMYSGAAVRTAIAIGLASGMSSLPAHMRKEGKRTWWCIYAHEIEMCVSSGRLDSMKELHYYQAPLPILKANNPNDPEAEDDMVTIIPLMVLLSGIMFEASHLLYHSTNRSITEMSQIAMTMDRKILEWKANLPDFLDLDAASLNDPEWAFKQKFVLKQRESDSSQGGHCRARRNIDKIR